MKWDLLGGMNLFSYKQFIFTNWNARFCRDLIQVRHLTWLGWFFSYKHLLGWVFLSLWCTHRDGLMRNSMKKSVKRNLSEPRLVADLKTCNSFENRIQHWCFPVNIAKFWRTSFLQNTLDDCFCKHKYLRNFR